MSQSEIEQLLVPNAGERFENSVEWGIDKARSTITWAKDNPRTASSFAAGAVGVWLGVQFGLPWAINKYHEVRASSDISSAEEGLFSLSSAQEDALEDLKKNRFIIKDELEPALEAKIARAGEQSSIFVSEISEAKAIFELGNYQEVRSLLEDNFDEEHQGPGLITRIEAEVPLVVTVSDYTTELRSRRDTALVQEHKLQTEMKEKSSGFTDPRLHNSLGVRLKAKESTFRYIKQIAIREGVKHKAEQMYGGARSSFLSAVNSFSSDDFVHYSEELDGTMDIADYNAVISSQSIIFDSISRGDSSLSRLVSYKGELTTQHLTTVTKRWRDSHEEPYTVKVDNPAYSEWIEQDCNQVCTTRYCSQRYCREMASGGTVTQDCTTVQEACGQDCNEVCNPITVDNGQPKKIPETRYRTIQEYWVKIKTQDGSGSSFRETDLKDQSKWNQRNFALGYQEWKPFGDDTTYHGVGRIGPNGETPYIMKKQ